MGNLVTPFCHFLPFEQELVPIISFSVSRLCVVYLHDVEVVLCNNKVFTINIKIIS